MPSLELEGQSDSLNLKFCQNLRLRKDLPLFKPLSVKEFKYTNEYFLPLRHGRKVSLINFVVYSSWDSWKAAEGPGAAANEPRGQKCQAGQ